MTSANDTTGLGLFDDAASAVGNFPSALRGYDRSAVDDYVRALEAAVVNSRRHGSALEEQLADANKQLSAVVEQQRAAEIDFTNLGERAREILRLAEEQARDVANQASVDAERLKEVARREADQTRQEAQQASAEIRSVGEAEMEQLRLRGQEDIQAQIDKTQAEGAAVVAAARRQAEALQRAAEHEAQTLRQNAYLDTENLRRSVELEVAEIRRDVAEERELAVNHLRSVQEEAVGKTGAVLAEATEQTRLATSRLETDIAEGARIRSDALAEAERLKLGAKAEADELLRAARKQAGAISERTHQEFSWRKQQLRREMDQLGQRKQAVLNQLASLSALAEQTANSFPDLDDLGGFDAEHGEPTLRSAPRPPQQAGNGPGETPDNVGPDQIEESSTQTHVLPVAGGTPSGERRPLGAAESGRPAVARPEATQSSGDTSGSPGATSDTEKNLDPEEDLEIDGDATIMVPASQLPAGTAHLRNGAGSVSN